MSSHGGIAGMTIVAWIYARKTNVSWLGLGDNLVTVSPVGVFFGRIANFVNGELYGRKTDGPISIEFPEELSEVVAAPNGFDWMFPTSQLRDLAERAGESSPGLLGKVDAAILGAMLAGRPMVAATAVQNFMKSLRVTALNKVLPLPMPFDSIRHLLMQCDVFCLRLPDDQPHLDRIKKTLPVPAMPDGRCIVAKKWGCNRFFILHKSHNRVDGRVDRVWHQRR